MWDARKIDMQKSAWKEIVNRTQLEYLPLITGCLFAIMIMVTLRDFMFTREYSSTWWYAFEYLTIALTAVIWVSAILKLIPVHFAHAATLASLLCIGVKAGVAVWLWGFNGPGNIMLTLFSTGLVMLSMPYAVAAQTIIFLCWLTPAILYLELSEVISNSAISIIGAGLGLMLLHRRVVSLRHVLELEHRVESLESILPMCSGCKKTRDENGNWISIESYIEAKDESTVVSHGLCPDCKQAHYGDFIHKHELTSKSIDG